MRCSTRRHDQVARWGIRIPRPPLGEGCDTFGVTARRRCTAITVSGDPLVSSAQELLIPSRYRLFWPLPPSPRFATISSTAPRSDDYETLPLCGLFATLPSRHCVCVRRAGIATPTPMDATNMATGRKLHFGCSRRPVLDLDRASTRSHAPTPRSWYAPGRFL